MRCTAARAAINVAQNAFQSGARKVVPAVLIYAFHGASHGEEVLLVHKSTANEHHGKWNGLGGKCDPDESIFETAAREFREECGLSLPEDRFEFKGLLQFPEFRAGAHEDWWVAVFVAELADAERAKVPASCAEGRLEFVPTARVMELPLWEGDRYFLPQILERERGLVGTIWYRDGKPVRHTIRDLS